VWRFAIRGYLYIAVVTDLVVLPVSCVVGYTAVVGVRADIRTSRVNGRRSCRDGDAFDTDTAAAEQQMTTTDTARAGPNDRRTDRGRDGDDDDDETVISSIMYNGDGNTKTYIIASHYII
jgi:hypothetical protein